MNEHRRIWTKALVTELKIMHHKNGMQMPYGRSIERMNNFIKMLKQ